MKTSELNLSTHARQVLAEQSIDTVEQLCRLPVITIRSFNQCAISTLRTLSRACLQVGQMPTWLPAVARDFEYSQRADLADFMPLAGPYNHREQHMLEAAIVQLGPIQWAVVQEPLGLMLWRSRVGCLVVEEEEL